jgi:hypothetical protein
MKSLRVLGRALAETVALFGLLVFLYAAARAASEPSSMGVPISRGIPVRTDTAGAIGFLSSLVAAATLAVGARSSASSEGRE